MVHWGFESRSEFRAASRKTLATLGMLGALIPSLVSLAIPSPEAHAGGRNLLDAAPAGFFEWSALSGLETCSSGLAHTLGASSVAVKTFRDLAPYFSESDFATLDAQVGNLRSERKPFDRVVRARNGRVLEACGRVVAAAGTV